MARNHMRLLVTVWEDPEWLALPSSHQTAYLALCSSQDLSWCGVHPLLPQRLVGTSRDMTERKVAEALKSLASKRFLVVDEKTAEISVRTFVRHDGILGQPNVTKAMVRALNMVRSKKIRASVKTELARVLQEHPQAKGWPTLRAMDADLFDELQSKGSGNPLPIPFPKGA